MLPGWNCDRVLIIIPIYTHTASVTANLKATLVLAIILLGAGVVSKRVTVRYSVYTVRVPRRRRTNQMSGLTLSN